MRRRSWYSRGAPRSKDRNLNAFLLVGLGLAVILGAVLLVFTGGGGSKPGDSRGSSGASILVPTQPPDGSGGVAPVTSATAEASTRDELPSKPIEGSGMVQVKTGSPFVWPANGRLAAEISPSHPGIDIALTDSAVVAAARGTIAFVGSGSQEDLIEVVIDHGNGLRTSYGRLERAFASLGDVVKQGQLIGQGASVESPVRLLRFEVTADGSQIDPLDLLGSQGAGVSSSAQVNCADQVIIIQSGAPLTLDFSGELGQDAIVARASLLNQTGSADVSAPQAQASVSGPAEVLFETLPSVVNTGGYAYTLIVETRRAGERERFTCTIGVRTRTVSPSPFFLPPTQSPSTAPSEPTSPSSTPTVVPAGGPTRVPSPVPTNAPILPSPTPTKTPFAG